MDKAKVSHFGKTLDTVDQALLEEIVFGILTRLNAVGASNDTRISLAESVYVTLVCNLEQHTGQVASIPHLMETLAGKLRMAREVTQRVK